jgi:hypothetical protein
MDIPRTLLSTFVASLALRFVRFRSEQVATKSEVDTKSMNIVVLEYSALLGVSVVGVMQLLQVPQLDLPLYISVIAFAVAIPMLTYGVYQVRWLQQYRYHIPSPWIDGMGWFAMLASLLGLIGIFWHFWWVAGTLFILCGSAVFVFALVFSSAIEKANAEANRDSEEPRTGGGSPEGG